MAHFERTATDSVNVEDRIEASIRRYGGTAETVVDRVHRQLPRISPSEIRTAMWDLVNAGRIEIAWDARLSPKRDVVTTRSKKATKGSAAG